MNKSINKKFDSVGTTLNIKQKLYSKNKKLSVSDYLRKLSQEAHESELWEKYKRKKTVGPNRYSYPRTRDKSKSFDAVGWVREIREEIYRTENKKKK